MNSLCFPRWCLLCGNAWASPHYSQKMPLASNGNYTQLETQQCCTGSQHTVHIISYDVWHSRGACQKIITTLRDVSGYGSALVHYKRQPSSLLSHSPLLPLSSWEPGEREPPSCLSLSSSGGLRSVDLSSATSSVP